MLHLLLKRPVAALSLSTVLWAVTGWTVAETTLKPDSMLAARSVISLVALAGLWHQLAVRPSLLDLIAGVSGGFITWFYYRATKAGDGAADLALAVLYTTPIWTCCLERVILGKKHPLWYLIAACVAAVGVTLLSTSWDKFNVELMLYGLAGALCFAVMLIALKLEKDVSDRGLLLALIVGLLLGLPSLSTEIPKITGSFEEAAVVVICGVATAGAYFLLTRAIRNVPPTSATIIQSGEVPLVLLGLWAIGKREPTVLQLVGVAIVFASCLTIAIHMGRKKDEG